MNQTLEGTNEVTRNYYNKLVSFYKASEEAVDSQKASYGPAETLLRKTEAFYKKGVQVVSHISGDRFGEETLGDKVFDGFATATANVASFFSGLGQHQDSKTLRDTYTNLVAASCGLEMLYATEVAGHGKSAHSEKLLELMKEHHELIMAYGHVIPETVVQELAADDEGAFSTAQTQEIVSDIQSTWH